MEEKFLTFVLAAFMVSIFSGPIYAQTNSNQADAPANEEAADSFQNATRLKLETLSAEASTSQYSLSFTAYTLGLEQDLLDRLTLQASLPLIMGSENNESFAMWGNAFFGANLKLLR